MGTDSKKGNRQEERETNRKDGNKTKRMGVNREDAEENRRDEQGRGVGTGRNGETDMGGMGEARRRNKHERMEEAGNGQVQRQVCI